jgi:hypothetical protein
MRLAINGWRSSELGLVPGGLRKQAAGFFDGRAGYCSG